MTARRIVPIILALAILPAGFQNCSKGFEAAGVTDKSSSSLCKAQQKSSSQKLKWPDLRCDDFSSYTCERRIFSPAVETMTHTLTECLAGGTICLNVDVRQFNTASAAGPDSRAEDFQPGGSYNHEEFKCSHRALHNGMAVFTGEKDSLEESLSEAMSACERARENP